MTSSFFSFAQLFCEAMLDSCATILTARCTVALKEIGAEYGTAHDGTQIGASSSDPAGGEGDHLVQQLQRLAATILELYHAGQLKHSGSDLLSHGASECQALLQELEEILSATYYKFYAYVSAQLPFWRRQLYTDASILKFSVLFISSALATCPADGEVPNAERRGKVDEEICAMIETLDLAIIRAGAAGHVRGRRWINETLALLEDTSALFLQDAEAGETSGPFSSWEPFTPPVKCPIRRTTSISLESFQTYLDSTGRTSGPEPLIISGLVDQWPAMTTRPWRLPSYLLSRTFGGRRLVPVEIGRSYVDEKWGQKLITLRDFLRNHVNLDGGTEPPPAIATAYLAQHALLAQLPVLRADVTIPDLCYTVPPPHPTHPDEFSRPELDEPDLNVWFGPPGTITPLHTDPYHNLLVQVVGRKYVRLYSPAETPRMRPRGSEGGVDMSNTSMWDVGAEEGWYCDVKEGGGEKSLAEFKEIPFVDCILEPGDTLYIPIGWWHYVQGLSASFSVSFWWN